MMTRYATALGTAATVTLGLLLVMQAMIATDARLDIGKQVVRLVDFVHVMRSPPAVRTEERPPKPPRTERRPAVEPLTTPTGPLIRRAVQWSEPELAPGRLPSRFAMDGELLPIVTVAPNYPARAIAANLEGYVIVEYVVTANGAVRDVTVIESSNAVFDSAAVDAAAKFKYRPRVVNGQPVEVYGVRKKITFVLGK